MRLPSRQPVWLLVLSASPAFGLFENFFFAGNKGNATGPVRCGDMTYDCPAPNMCSQDTLTRKWYCCETGNEVGPCWVGSTKCEGTGTNVPSSNQVPCSNLNVNYCCLKDSEQCTKNAKQFNICYSTNPNPVRALNNTRLNETYLSLSRASPSAASFTINQQSLLAQTSTTPGASSATTTPAAASASASASVPGSASASASTTPISAPADSSSGLSGGAIGGIVGGVVGGLALLGLIGFFLWRRKKSAGKVDPHTPAGDPYQSYGYQPSNQPPVHEAGYSPQPGMAQMHSPQQHQVPLDKYAHVQHQGPVEVPANNGPVEMDASYYAPQHYGK